MINDWLIKELRKQDARFETIESEDLLECFQVIIESRCFEQMPYQQNVKTSEIKVLYDEILDRMKGRN